MKKCMICGWDESDASRHTCPACGEASWLHAQPPTPELAVVQVESAPAKRGPGRPRKVQ